MSPSPYILLVTTLMFVVVAYLGSIFYLIGYLRRFHTPTWAQLGRPAMPTIAEHASNPWPFVRSGFLTMGFIFGRQFRALDDARLNRLVWTVRMLLIVGVLGTIILALASAA
jgi:hypothetical protein